MSDSKRMIHIYRGLGLHLVAADKSVWAGIDVVKDGLVSGRLKFFNTLTMLREEYEGYHTGENGKIVKDYDDILDALRYSYGAMKSIAKTAPVKRREQPIQKVSFGDWF